METNKELLLRIEDKVDRITKEIAEEKLNNALRFSDMHNANDTRFKSLENYLKSDPSTNQMGAIEKLNSVDKRVSKLEATAMVFGAIGGIVIALFKWLVSVIF